MDQERWRRVEGLFEAALELKPEARRAFLDDACNEDIDLQREVELLLANEKKAGSFLETPILAGPTATEAATASLLGRQFGVYRIVSPLGAGGMGEVYRAHDNKLGRDVAIKTLPPEFAQNPDWLALLRREARTLASLNHRNIGAIYGLEESEEAHFLVLELVEGETLRGALPIPTALDRALQVTEALEAAHGKGVIHRDLKPANVKVTPQGTVKVLDFGLAKAILGPEQKQDVSQAADPRRAGTLAGHIFGTPGYMSPEQANRKSVDKRTDTWAFGCLLYELLTGKRAFQGETESETIAAVLQKEPDWHALPARTPTKIRELLRQCLQKDANRRLDNIADARKTIEEVQRGWNRWRVAAVAAIGLALLTASGALWLRSPSRAADRSRWVQLTQFPDAVSQPALSPDGRMLAFIRGSSTFVGPGEIYVKTLPNGEPARLTHDNLDKMSPAFSPDGTRIAYTVVDPQFGWNTSIVPVSGGEPKLLLKNASGLVWSGPRQMLFSEIKTGENMAIVTSGEGRAGQRDVYVPADEQGMAHRAYISPDGKWALLVEMDQDNFWLPCRLVPADGRTPGHRVGPPGGACTSGAWSPDGKWMYFTSNAIGSNHIWRQPFPDGTSEQITSGPTEEEGIAMAPDGRSFVTAVALQNASLWAHYANGERQISPEGNAADPAFTPDGKNMLYRVVREAPNAFGFYNFYRNPSEVRVVDPESGHSEPLARGLLALNYDVSVDGRQVVMEIADREGKPRVCLASLDGSAPVRQIPNVEGKKPKFGPDGEILFRHMESKPGTAGSSGFIYRVRPDGTGMRKALEQPVDPLWKASRDGRWIEFYGRLPGNGPLVLQYLPLDGGSPILIGTGWLDWVWSANGGAVAISSNGVGVVAEGRTYIIPLPRGQMFPRIPAGGFHSEEEIARLPGARKIDVSGAVPGPSPDVYAFHRGTSQRNLYRIPIP